jgi:predicted  nucleic acid-binding Zn-ribbon protein
MERVETNMKELEDNLSTYNGTMNTFYTNALSKIETIKDLITKIRSDIEQYQIIQKEYNDSQVRVAALKNQIESLNADMERLQEANRKLREEQNADQQLRQQLEALQKELRELRNEQSRLEEQLGIANAGNQEKDKQIQAYSTDIESKKDEIAQKQRELDENASNIEIMRKQMEIMRTALEREREREGGLGGQLEAYGDRIVQLNTLLQQLSGDPRAEQVQKGLDEIIDQLNGLTNNSGGPGGPRGPPERSSRFLSRAPGPEPESRPDSPDNQSTEFQIGDTTGTSEERAEPVDGNDIPSSSSEEQQKILAPGERLPPITRSAHKVLGVNKKTNEDIIIDFPTDVHGDDVKARTKQIEKIVDDVYLELGLIKDQKVKKIVKGEEKIDYPHTIRMAASVGSMNRDEKLKMRKMVREKLMEWQNTHERDGKTPFKDFYLSDKKEDKNYSPKNGKHDPFNVEFPYHESTNYKTPMDRPSSKGGKTKGKKTRRKQGGKSKNKTIRYKRRKNRKQSKK